MATPANVDFIEKRTMWPLKDYEGNEMDVKNFMNARIEDLNSKKQKIKEQII